MLVTLMCLLAHHDVDKIDKSVPRLYTYMHPSYALLCKVCFTFPDLSQHDF